MKSMTTVVRAIAITVGICLHGFAVAVVEEDSEGNLISAGGGGGSGSSNGGSGGGSVATLPPVEVTGQLRTTPVVQVFYFGDSGGSGGGRDFGGGGGGASSSQGSSSSNRQTSASQNNSPTDTCEKSPTSGNPVVIATGEKVQTEQDFNDFGDGGLSLTRIYRSNTVVPGLFGSKWRSSLDFPKVAFDPVCYPTSKFGCMPEEITISRPDGARKSYMLISMVSPKYIPVDTGSDGTGWGSLNWSALSTVVTIDNKRYTFQTNTGRVTQIARAGLPLYTLAYGTAGLASITHRSGRAVQFAWANGLVSQVTDPDSKVWTYQYDSAKNLTSVTPPSGTAGMKVYHYEDSVSASLLTGISIDGVRSTRYIYDGSQRVYRSGKENAETFEQFAYSGNSTTVSHSRGQSITYTFEQSGDSKRLVGTTRASTSTCAAAAASQAYDANGYLDYAFDWNGVKTDYTYNPNGQLLEVIYGAGTSEAYRQTNTWAAGTMLQESLVWGRNGAPFRKTAYTYDTTKWLPTGVTVTDLRTSQARTTSIAYTFHASGVMVSRATTVFIGASSATTWEYFNTLGYLTQVVNPLGQSTTYSNHNGYGQPQRVVDINGVATDTTYDTRGNPTSASTTLPNGTRSTSVAYNGWGLATSVQRTGFGTQGYAYNSAGRLIQSTFAGDSVTYGFDPVSRISTTTAPRHAPGFSGSALYATSAGSFVTTRIADSLGRLMRVIGNNGQQTTYTYDANGNLNTATDSASRVTTYLYDVLNRPTLVTLPDNTTIRTDYDADGNVWKVTDGRGLVTLYGYNGFGDLTSVSSPDSGTTGYGYDAGGRRSSEARANGISIVYGYDAKSRLISRTSGGVSEQYCSLSKIHPKDSQVTKMSADSSWSLARTPVEALIAGWNRSAPASARCGHAVRTASFAA